MLLLSRAEVQASLERAWLPEEHTVMEKFARGPRVGAGLRGILG